MKRHSQLQIALTGIAVLLLLTATFAAGVCHDHHGASDATCQICHVSHQPADQQMLGHGVATPMVVNSVVQIAEVIRASGPAVRISVSRAPPTA